MSFLNTVLKSFLGDKNAKDLKEVKKVVAKIKAAEPNIQTLTDDGLREKTAEFKEKIKEKDWSLGLKLKKHFILPIFYLLKVYINFYGISQ